MILVCGDAMVDRYISGRVDRISPEAPVPVVLVEKEETRDGGAANVLANVRALGAQVRGNFSVSSWPEKVRIISQGQHIVRFDRDWPQEPLENITPERFVLFSDYGKGSLANIPQLIAQCLDSIILVDPKGRNWDKYRGAHYIKPNLAEFKDLVGGWTSEEALHDLAWEVVRTYNLSGLLLTRGGEGMTFFSLDDLYHVESQAQEVYDVCGAGDTAIATFTVGLSLGLHPHAATHYANKAAGIAVRHLGAYVARRDEVFTDLERMS